MIGVVSQASNRFEWFSSGLELKQQPRLTKLNSGFHSGLYERKTQCSSEAVMIAIDFGSLKRVDDRLAGEKAHTHH
jgi:hypothetical protein